MAHTYSFPGTKLSLCWLFCRGLLVICWTRMGTGGKEGPFGDLRTTTLHSTYQYVGLYIPYLDPGSKNFPSKVPHKSWILDSGSKYSGILKSIYPTCRYLVSGGEHSWINMFFCWSRFCNCPRLWHVCILDGTRALSYCFAFCPTLEILRWFHTLGPRLIRWHFSGVWFLDEAILGQL